MKRQYLFALAVLSALSACARPTTSAPPRSSSNQQVAEVSAPNPECSANQFVACESGEACARKQEVFVNPPKACFDHAEEACKSLACAHGCDIYHGAPLEIHCAPNASSTGNMKRCGGLANWACPENMKCEFGPDAEKTDDASGTCVPIGS